MERSLYQEAQYECYIFDIPDLEHILNRCLYVLTVYKDLQCEALDYQK